MKATNETEKIISEQLSALNKIGAAENLEEWRVNTLGRQGVITSILKSISSLPVEERKAAGSAANQGKIRLQDAFDIKQKQLWQMTLPIQMILSTFLFQEDLRLEENSI